MAKPKNIVSTEDIEQKDREAAAEVIEHLTSQEPLALDALPPIEPLDQTQPPAPPVGTPPNIVDLDSELEQPTRSAAKKGVSFFCGEVGILVFEDGTKYHVKSRHFTSHDTALIKNLKKASENPSNKIFVTTE